MTKVELAEAATANKKGDSEESPKPDFFISYGFGVAVGVGGGASAVTERSTHGLVRRQFEFGADAGVRFVGVRRTAPLGLGPVFGDSAAASIIFL